MMPNLEGGKVESALNWLIEPFGIKLIMNRGLTAVLQFNHYTIGLTLMVFLHDVSTKT